LKKELANSKMAPGNCISQCMDINENSLNN